MNIEAVKVWPYKRKLKLREVFVVTEWREDCIYKTKSLGFIVAENMPFKSPALLSSLSTKISERIFT